MTAPVLASDIRPAAHLYDATGATFIADLPTARKTAWLDESSKPGNASFEIPIEDAAEVTLGQIVKFSQYGAIRFGVRLRSEKCQLAVDGRRWLRYENQPGILADLDQATILPEYGLTRSSGRSRNFGAMSADGPWRVAADWAAPVAVPWADAANHGRYPAELAASNPSWIAADPGPEVIIPYGTVNYFRREFYVDTETVAEILVTADDEITLYKDGEEIATARDAEQRFGWRNCMSIPAVFTAGNHVMAANVADDAPGSLIGLIMTIYRLDSQGNRSTVLLKTDTNWIVTNGTDNPPGWHRAQVLLKVIEEARNRGVPGPSNLAMGFDEYTDTDGEDWTDRGEYPLPIATVGLADIATQLAESEMDVAVDAATMTLNAWKRRGSDLSGTVALTLGSGATGTLKEYETAKETSRRTVVISQMANGRWVETIDPAVDTLGRTEVGLDLGSVSNAATATDVATARLAELADPPIAIAGKTTALEGAVPYVDYNIGDTITVPGHRGIGTIKARVLALTVNSDDNNGVDAYPELMEDRSV